MRYSFRRRLLLPQAFIQQLQLTAILYVSVAFGLAASVSESVQQSLAQAALAEILQRGAPILGEDSTLQRSMSMSTFKQY